MLFLFRFGCNNYLTKCISVVIAKTASRNVAFKVAKMREAIMEDQDEFLMRNSEHTDVGVEANNRAQLEDVQPKTQICILPIKRLTSNMQHATLGAYAPLSVHERS